MHVRLTAGANVYEVAKNCRTSVEMIQKHYAAHILDEHRRFGRQCEEAPEAEEDESRCPGHQGEGRLICGKVIRYNNLRA